MTPSGLNAKDLAKKLNRQKVVADLDAVEVAARRGGKARQPLIHWACKEGRMDFVAAYLERKTADTNLASPNDGMTPVMEAAKHGQVGTNSFSWETYNSYSVPGGFTDSAPRT